jgi:hypothetical protein
VIPSAWQLRPRDSATATSERRIRGIPRDGEQPGANRSPFWSVPTIGRVGSYKHGFSQIGCIFHVARAPQQIPVNPVAIPRVYEIESRNLGGVGAWNQGRSGYGSVGDQCSNSRHHQVILARVPRGDLSIGPTAKAASSQPSNPVSDGFNFTFHSPRIVSWTDDASATDTVSLLRLACQ